MSVRGLPVSVVELTSARGAQEHGDFRQRIVAKFCSVGVCDLSDGVRILDREDVGGLELPASGQRARILL
jgi:hypothetical protein